MSNNFIWGQNSNNSLGIKKEHNNKTSLIEENQIWSEQTEQNYQNNNTRYDSSNFNKNQYLGHKRVMPKDNNSSYSSQIKPKYSQDCNNFETNDYNNRNKRYKSYKVGNYSSNNIKKEKESNYSNIPNNNNYNNQPFNSFNRNNYQKNNNCVGSTGNFSKNYNNNYNKYNGQNTYKKFKYISPNVNDELPIFSVKNKIIEAISKNRVTIISGNTGCGKSTQVPQYIYGINCENKILMTQPRRIAAVSIAKRLAEEMGDKLGKKVGYHVSMNPNFGLDTKIFVKTTGIFMEELIHKNLEYSHIIIDEVHERDIYVDLVLALVK